MGWLVGGGAGAADLVAGLDGGVSVGVLKRAPTTLAPTLFVGTFILNPETATDDRAITKRLEKNMDFIFDWKVEWHG